MASRADVRFSGHRTIRGGAKTDDDHAAAPASNDLQPEPQAGLTLGSFLAFRYMITPVLVQGIYVLVAVVITIYGLVVMFGGAGQGGPLEGLLVIVLGNLVWRVYMEIVMLFFRINEGIQRVEQNTRR